MKDKLLCRPIMLPGNGPIFNCPDGLYIRHMTNRTPMHQHLYLISDIEIKKGDWYEYYGLILKAVGDGEKGQTYASVIATTDKSLGLPLIPQSFIEEYVQKQGKTDKVYTECVDGVVTELGNIVNGNELNTYVTILSVKDSWNAEELRDEVKRAYITGWHNGWKDRDQNNQVTPDEWFDKNY